MNISKDQNKKLLDKNYKILKLIITTIKILKSNKIRKDPKTIQKLPTIKTIIKEIKFSKEL